MSRDDEAFGLEQNVGSGLTADEMYEKAKTENPTLGLSELELADQQRDYLKAQAGMAEIAEKSSQEDLAKAAEIRMQVEAEMTKAREEEIKLKKAADKDKDTSDLFGIIAATST
jgi:hypothetical protein